MTRKELLEMDRAFRKIGEDEDGFPIYEVNLDLSFTKRKAVKIKDSKKKES